MRGVSKLFFLVLILNLQGCQSFLLGNPSPPVVYKVPAGLPEQEQAFYLLKLTQQYSELNKNQEALACKELTKEYAINPTWQVAWVLVHGLNNDFKCLSLSKTQKLIIDIQAKQSFDLQLQWVNENKARDLKGIQVRNKKYSRLRRKFNESQEQLQELESKIQALKAIESSINKKLNYERPGRK